MFFAKELVSSHYLRLMNDLYSGVPLSMLYVANSVNNLQDFDSLLLRLKKPIVSKIRKKLIPKFGDLWYVNRVKALELADAAKIENRYRLAIKHYGLLVLMSESIDNPLKWAIYQLRDISENIYEIPLPSSNSMLLQQIKN